MLFIKTLFSRSRYFYLTAMAHKINKPFLAHVPVTTEEVFKLFQKAKASPTMSFEKWPAFLLRELTHLSMAAGYMQGGGKVVTPSKKAKPTAKFTLSSGLNNLAADLTDSSTLATKSWKWTPPTLDAGGAEPGPHFITIRHGANILAVLLDANGLKKWQHDPNAVEKDYAFNLPGGLTGTCTAIRLGTYSPGSLNYCVHSLSNVPAEFSPAIFTSLTCRPEQVRLHPRCSWSASQPCRQSVCCHGQHRLNIHSQRDCGRQRDC